MGALTVERLAAVTAALAVELVVKKAVNKSTAPLFAIAAAAAQLLAVPAAAAVWIVVVFCRTARMNG